MVNIEKVKKGDILITQEFSFGRLYYIYGPVVLIDYERQILGIKMGEDIRSFPPEQLSTIYDFVNNCRAGRSPNADTMKTLMGYIVSLAEGQTNALQEIADFFKKQGVKPAASQDVLESLLVK